MNSMLEQFISEARDLLESAGECFLALEDNPKDPESLNGLFRAVHTIKGASGLFEIAPLTNVLHAAEDVLDVAREGELLLEPEIADLLVEGLDQVSYWLDILEDGGALPVDAEAVGSDLASRIRKLLGESKSGQIPDPGEDSAGELQEQTEDEKESAIEWLAAVDEPTRLQLFRETATMEKGVIAVEYVPEEGCFFCGDDPFHTVRIAPGVRWISVENRSPWPKPEELDPFTCLMVFRLVSVANREEIEEHFRYVSDQVRLAAVTAEDLVMPCGTLGDPDPFGAYLEDAVLALEAAEWERLLEETRAVLEMSGPALIQTSALCWIKTLLESGRHDKQLIEALLHTVADGKFQRPEMAEEMEETDALKVSTGQDAPAGPAGEDLEAVRKILQSQVRMLRMPVDAALWKGKVRSTETVLRHVFSSCGWTDPGESLHEAVQEALETTTADGIIDTVEGALHKLESRTEATPALDVPDPQSRSDPQKMERVERSSAPPPRQPIKMLKVDPERINQLMALVGELVVGKNALPYLADRAENEFSVRPLAREIKNQYMVINRIAEDLQRAVMQVRMVPVAHIFQRFPRLVREQSRKLGKKIRLVMEGEETELDKNVVEALSEPLVHLVRNSIDHGIEGPEDRVAVGKEPEGTITLRAIQLEDQAIIEIIDDGAGMDPDVIRRKAYDKGLISDTRLDSLSDEEALQLIFEPGFSTAETVSELSGRGVGMDVVRTMISRVGGSVDLRSMKGHGTTTRLSLPLSMAVTRILMVDVGGETFGVPIDSIRETVRIPPNSIHHVKNREVVILRDRMIPIFRPSTVLGGDGRVVADGDRNGEESVLVVSVDGHELGLVVDQFRQDVDILLKPLEGFMERFTLYSGAALLGDGRVLLVLNVEELVKCL